MSEARLVDAIRDEAIAALRRQGIDEVTIHVAVREMMLAIRDKHGGEKHWVHRISVDERAHMLALDTRSPSEIAADLGVSVRTVHRARSRRVISSGVR